MLRSMKRGSTSVVLRVKLYDSTKTDGSGLTGLTNTSAGLIISAIASTESSAAVYAQASSNIETITTLGTYAAPSTSKCRFKELDATNHKGVYEIQLADARFAVSNSQSLLVSISGATGLAQQDFIVQLEDTAQGELTTTERSAISAAILADTVDSTGSITVLKALKGVFSALCGVTTVSGATYTAKTADGTATRITYTLDSNKQRTAVTLNL